MAPLASLKSRMELEGCILRLLPPTVPLVGYEEAQGGEGHKVAQGGEGHKVLVAQGGEGHKVLVAQGGEGHKVAHVAKAQ